MRQIVLSALLTGCLAACGGGGGSSGNPGPPTPADAQSPGGIWFGIDSAGESVVFYIAETGELRTSMHPEGTLFVSFGGGSVNVTSANVVNGSFELRGALAAQAVRLLADPFVYGEKTPIGSTLGDLASLDPDSLASGVSMQYDITSLIRAWTLIPSEAAFFPLRVGIVPVPENRQFGFWEFFSREDGPGLRPVVHLLFTPNPSFLLP